MTFAHSVSGEPMPQLTPEPTPPHTPPPRLLWRDGTELQLFATTPDPGVLHLRLVGEVDIANADGVAREIDRQLRVEHRTVRLYLARLSFCDCAGLRAMVDLHNRMLHRRGTLHLVAPSPPVRRLLRLTELDRALNLAAT